MKCPLCEKALLGPGQTFPADIADLVIRLDEGVVMIDLAVAFGAADDGFSDRFRIQCFNHCVSDMSAIVYLKVGALFKLEAGIVPDDDGQCVHDPVNHLANAKLFSRELTAF